MTDPTQLLVQACLSVRWRVPIFGEKMASSEVKAAFEEVEKKFQWDPKVTKWLLAPDGLGATSLNDFLFAATEAKELGTIADQAGCENKLLMTSRIRQAWTSLKTSSDDKEKLKRKNAEDVEMDSMLPQMELDDLAAKHYHRYRMVWPPEIMPSDQLISRVSKEMDKRLRGVTQVWKGTGDAAEGSKEEDEAG